MGRGMTEKEEKEYEGWEKRKWGAEEKGEQQKK